MKGTLKIYHKKINDATFLYTGEALSCEKCGVFPTAGFYFEGYSSIMPAVRLFLCGNCKKDHKPVGYDVLNEQILVVGYVPNNASIWIPQPPALVTTSANSVFSLAMAADGSEVIDNTVHANRLSLEGASIGKSLEDLRESSDDDIPLILSAKPILPGVNVELLEGEKNE